MAAFTPLRSRRTSGVPLLLGLVLLVGLLAAGIGPARAAGPTLTAITPNAVTAGGAGFTLTVTGSNFDPSASYIRLNAPPPSLLGTKDCNGQGGTPTTTIVDSSTLSVNVPASYIATGGQINVSVVSGGTLTNKLTLDVASPVPTLTSISPTSAGANTGALTLTATGSNFSPSSVIRFNGVDATGMVFTSATSITGTIPASALTAPGVGSVVVATPAPGGGTSTPQPFAVQYPYPSLTAITPASVPKGSASATLTLTGSNFFPTSTVVVDLTTLTPTTSSPTQLTVAVPAATLASPRSVSVKVVNPTPGGGTSGGKSFTVVDPTPTLTNLSPTSAQVGSATLTLTVTGANFANDAVVTWNGTALPTSVVPGTQLSAVVSTTLLAATGTATIGVTNVGYGYSSGTQPFTIQNPAPALNRLTPDAALTGSSGVTVTLIGTNFVAASQVTWNGQVKPATLVSDTRLTVNLSSAELATSATVPVTVTTPAPGGGTSASLNFTVSNPAPVLSAITPVSALAGSPALSLTVTGSGFTPASTITCSGSSLSTTYGSSTTLTGLIPSMRLAATGTCDIAVNTPAPGGGTSTSIPFRIAQPATLQAGTPQQNGAAVTLDVAWTGNPESVTVNCGTTPTQTLTRLNGTCAFTTPGTYSLTGTYSTAERTYTVAPIDLAIPALPLQPMPLVPTINGQPASALQVYSLPISVDLPLVFTVSAGTGIIDVLDLSVTRLTVSRDGGAPARLTPRARDPLHYDVTTSLPAAGTYTFTLEGSTQTGQPITTSATLVLSLATLGLQTEAPVQQGPAVAVPVRWPETPGVTNQTADCGSAPAQILTGPTGTCVYTQAGTYTITGRFTDPTGTPNVSTASATVTIPAVAPTAAALSLALNGQPATGQSVETTLPAALDVTLTLAPPAGIGILDPVTTSSASATVQRQGGPTSTVTLAPGNDPLTFTGSLLLPTAATYHVAFAGRTQRGTPLSASAYAVLTGTPLRLQFGGLSQDAPRQISIPVAWPSSITGTSFRVNCGTPRAQIVTGSTGTCVYTAPGTYSIAGSYVPQGVTTTVPAETTDVTIPALRPSSVDIAVAFPGSGALREEPESTPDARIFRLTPVRYPLDIQVDATVSPVPEAGLGILESLDRSSVAMTMQLLSTSDGRQFDPAPTVALPVRSDPTQDAFGVRTTMRGFDLGTGTPKVSGRSRLTFQGKTPSGAEVIRTATVIIDEPLLEAVAVPYGIQGPYAPASYRYRVNALRTNVKRERLSLVWTLSRQGADEPIRVVKNATTFIANLPEPGTYRVTLELNGSVSGAYHWSEDIVVPTPPPADTPLIQISGGGPQRPPVQYQLKALLPPLDPGDRYTTIEWSLDGTKLERPANRAHIATPGPHTVQVTAHTAAGQDKTATLPIEVRENMSPRGTMDCSPSRPAQADAVLRCSAAGLDPDGRIMSRRWVVPELGLDAKGGWTLRVSVPTPPPQVTVQLHMTDNSGTTEVLTQTVPLQLTDLTQ